MISELTIQMFGEFSITNEFHRFVATTANSKQIILLLAYLLSNHETEIPKQRLMEILWPEDDCKNPAGALRNLVYRTRKELSPFFPETDINCILLSGSSYYWNPEIPCKIDICCFETNYCLGQKTSDSEEKISCYRSMIDLYKGSFLSLYSSEEWVIYRSVYYHRLFTQALLSLIDHLHTTKDYNEIMNLCDYAIEIEPTDERIHKAKLKAMVSSDHVPQALDYYTRITGLFSEKYCIDITESLQEIYQLILRTLPKKNMSIDGLEKTLRQSSPVQKGFFCNLDVFRTIYQLNINLTQRYHKSQQALILLTLEGSPSSRQLSLELRTEMAILYKILSGNLRSCDVFTQSSFSQYSLLLPISREHPHPPAVDKVRQLYEHKRVHSDIRLLYAVHPITF